MPIELSREKLVEILGVSVVPTSERIIFNSVSVNYELIRGGELLVIYEKSTDVAHNIAEQALARGAALVMYSTQLFLDINRQVRCLVVSDLDKALHTLASWWYQRFNTASIIIFNNHEQVCKDYLAALLLTKSVGVYSLGHTKNSRIDIALTLLRLNANHEWVLIDIVATDTQLLTEYLSFLKVELVLTSNAELPLVLPYFNTQILRPQIVVADYDLSKIGIAEIKDQNLHMVETSDDYNLILKSELLNGFSGSSCEYAYRDQSIILNLKMPGRSAINAAGLAMLALFLKYKDQEFDYKQIVNLLARVPISSEALQVVYLNNGKKLVGLGVGNIPERAWINEQLSVEITKVNGWGLVIARFYEDLLQAVEKFRPEYVISITHLSVEVIELIKTYNIKLFQVASCTAAAHTIFKTKAELALVIGEKRLDWEALFKVALSNAGEVNPQ